MSDAAYPDPPRMIAADGEALRGHAGPLEYRPDQCEAMVPSGDSCTVRATWRVVATDPTGAGDGTVEWLICQPHLGEAVMLADENYGSPVEVHRHV